MIPARLLYCLLIAAVAILFASIWLPRIAAVAWALDAVLLIIVLVDAQITPDVKNISAQRFCSDRLSIGRQNEVLIEVFSNALKPVQVQLRDCYPIALEADVQEFDFKLADKSRARLEYMLFPRRRGEYEFGDITIRYRSALGLFWRQLNVPASKKVRVYPDLKALQELSVKLAHSSELGVLKVRKRGQGTDFSSLREYVSGDDIRSMDWKATARRDRPVLRVYEVEKEQTLMVLVDAGRMMVSDLEGLSRFDHALNAALSLVLTGLMRNDQVGLGIFADKPLLFMPPRRGKSYLTKILEACCDLRPKMVEPDYMGALSFFASAQKSRSLMVLISDLTDPTGSASLLTGLASLSPRHLPFCVTLRDREVDRISELSAPDLPGIMKRAVANDLIAQRELAFSHIVRRGCLLLDCPPQDLSSRLVDKYLEIKARGLL